MKTTIFAVHTKWNRDDIRYPAIIYLSSWQKVCDYLNALGEVDEWTQDNERNPYTPHFHYAVDKEFTLAELMFARDIHVKGDDWYTVIPLVVEDQEGLCPSYHKVRKVVTMTYTYHASVERCERLYKLEQMLGFTNIVLEVPMKGCRYCLTSSGIIILKCMHEEKVITAYMATIAQCYRMYLAAGKSQISPKMYKRVSKNVERHPELFEIKNQVG